MRTIASFCRILVPGVLLLPFASCASDPENPGGSSNASGTGIGGSAAGQPAQGGTGTAGTAGTGNTTAGSGTNGGSTGGSLTSGGSAGSTLVAGAPAGGSAGAPANAGAAGTSTAGSTNAMAGSGGSASSVCTFQMTQTMSAMIPTVGIVDWSADLPSIESAYIDYGLDTNYGLRAPVDLAEPNRRTLLLGMKTSRTYHFRITAVSGGTECRSGDYTLMTGARPNNLAEPEVETPHPERLAGGFLITARWGNNNDGPAMILDADTDLVWWYPGEGDVIRARMSYDGKKMWIRNTAQLTGQGVVLRISLDGSNEERFELPPTTHDLAVLPDGKVGLIAHADDGCDEILEFDPETQMTRTLFNAREAHGMSSCHVNYLGYHAGDDSYVFSDYEASSFIKITRQGNLVWVLNGSSSTFTGTSWSRQHGIHILTPEHVLLFSNGAPGQDSMALEYMLNTTSMTAQESWRYDAGVSATFGGDIQRLANGNTVISYSSAGIVQEVDSEGTLLQSMTWPIGNTVSYIEKRPTLYGGPPPKINGL